MMRFSGIWGALTADQIIHIAGLPDQWDVLIADVTLHLEAAELPILHCHYTHILIEMQRARGELATSLANGLAEVTKS